MKHKKMSDIDKNIELAETLINDDNFLVGFDLPGEESAKGPAQL